MSNKLIQPLYYYDSNHFDYELENIFKKHWLFACLTSEIAKKNDYVTIDLGKYSIIIYNTGEEIKAFQNACPHRFNRIFIEKKGNSPLYCQFHAWVFDKCGVLKNELKLENSMKIEKPKLKEYKIEILGQFVFFHFDSNPNNSLLKQLNGLEEELLLVSNIIGNNIHFEYNPHKVNWKFICENVIDNKHCVSLHKETLVSLGYCLKPADKEESFGMNSRFTWTPVENVERNKRDKFLNKHLPRKLQTNEYQHSLYFPNLTIAIFDGLNITIGSILPKTAQESDYRLNYYQSKIEKNNIVTEDLLDSIAFDVINFGTKIFEEDKVILERVQLGVMEIDHSGYVYSEEIRMKWFYNTYLDSLNG
jgi:choline monooxygenase